VKTIDEFLYCLAASLDPAGHSEFGEAERMILKHAMAGCNMREYPALRGDRQGEIAAGDMICEFCGLEYFAHPLDWRVIGYGNVPFLNVLCDGRRVKL